MHEILVLLTFGVSHHRFAKYNLKKQATNRWFLAKTLNVLLETGS